MDGQPTPQRTRLIVGPDDLEALRQAVAVLKEHIAEHPNEAAQKALSDLERIVGPA